MAILQIGLLVGIAAAIILVEYIIVILCDKLCTKILGDDKHD